MDILTLLPADTLIVGCVGDSGYYRGFEGTPATVRENVAKACVRHTEGRAEHFRLKIVSSETTHSSYWIHDEVQFVACPPEFPGLRLLLTTHDGDIRSEWEVEGIEVSEVYGWEQKSLPEHAAYFRKLADLLDKLAGA